MEKIPAACAMEWSIEFEKGLRSRKPGQSFESIKKLGERLVEWNEGPKLTIPMSSMYDLVSGEERLFVDGILLRLAAVFASGDKDTRFCIVKVLYSTFRRRCKKRRGENAILMAMSLSNQRELLSKVRAVLDEEDVESKASCLIFIGCLAVITKDVAVVRYAIFSSLKSSNVMEVKASFFAAGCLSELSDDFAAVFLEMLINIVTGPSTSLVLRLAATKSFTKFGNFLSLARKAHKVGLELVLKYPEEELSIAMMISLTKIAITSMPLIFEQFGLLFSFLNQTTTLRLRATALRCIHYIVKRQGCHLLISRISSDILFGMLCEADLPSSLRCEALKIVLKVVSCMSSDVLLMHVHELEKLLTLSENSTMSKYVSESLLEMQVIIDMSSKLKGRMKTVCAEVCPEPLSRVTSLVCDRLTELMKLVLSHNWSSDMEKQLKILLKLLLCLVNAHPHLASSVLQKLCAIILHIAKERGMDVDNSISTSAVHVTVGADKNLERFMLFLYKFVAACLESLYEAEAATREVFCSLKHLVSSVCHCSLFSCFTHTVYALLLYPVANWACILSEASTDNFQHNPVELLGSYSEIGNFFIECPRNILAGDKWFSYIAGKYAACNGSWSIANSIFEKLSVSNPSCAYSRWLRALAQVGYLERQVQSLFMKVGCSGFLNHVLSGEFIEELVAICDGFSSTEKMFASNDLHIQMFCFQRWFLGLRRKGLEALVDILKLLCTVQLGKDDQITSPDGILPLEQMTQLQCFLDGISSKFERLARECDLLASSFFDMDRKSLKVTSSLALSCSLLAFSTGFAYFYPNSSALEDLMSCPSMGSGNCLHVILVQNLIGRLCHIDSDTCMTLVSLLRSDRLHEACFHSQPRFPISRSCSQELLVHRACRNAAEAVAHLQKESMTGHEQDALLRATRNATLVLLNVIKDWMHVPFRLPTYFFKVRPCIGAFLFASIFSSKSGAEPVIPQGSHLSLNLCLQLKNVPPELTSQLKKVYCILHCKSSSLIRPHRASNGQKLKLIDHRAWTTDNMLHMHEKLRSYVLDMGETISDRGSGGHGVVEACICFETNGMRQAFSTCLLDVSAFPVGSYRIQWHSSCADSRGSYNTVLPLNDGPVFIIAES